MDINIISKKEEKERKKSEHVKRNDKRKGENEGNKIGNEEYVQRMQRIRHNYGIESY